MGWAAGYIKDLKQGRRVEFRPRGHSMAGRVENGQLCVVAPLQEGEPKAGDVVLCKVRGREYLHLVKAIQGKRYQIGNNKGRINGWVSRDCIFGKLVE